jgi:hypothetical protein
MSNQRNLFAALNNWAARNRQDENFVTEAFAYVLKHLIREECTIAAALLNLVMHTDPPLAISDLNGIVVIPHPRTDCGCDIIYPDIELRYRDVHLTFLEAKVGSRSPKSQFNKYIAALKARSNKYRNVNLVYATRDPVPFKAKDGLPVWNVRWREIWELLERKLELAQDSNTFLLKEFCSYLRGKGATIKDFEKEWREKNVERGSLGMWLEKAAKMNGLDPTAAKAGSHKKHAWDGYYLRFSDSADEKQFSFGFHFGRPFELIFTTLNFAIDTDLIPVNSGEVVMWPYRNNRGFRWLRTTSLGPEFFELTDNEKWKTFSSFLAECVGQAKLFEMR